MRHQGEWTFLTNHAHVLLAVTANADALVNDIAELVQITPRATLLILKDLEDAGYLSRERVGRRTHYTLVRHQHFRHPTLAEQEIDQLLAILTPDSRL